MLQKIQGNDDAEKADWFRIDDLPELAFDHFEIIKEALERYCSEKEIALPKI